MKTKANFDLFNEVLRQYEGDSPIMLFNGKETRKFQSAIVQKDTEIINRGTGFKYGSKIFVDKAHKLFKINDFEFITKELIQGKRSFKPGNYSLYHNTLVCVGNKRPSTHLPAGLIIELKKVKLNENW